MEGAATGTLIGITASAGNPDGGPVFYSLVGGAVGIFAIDENTGVIAVADGQALDFEANVSREIIVRASSSNGLFTKQTFTVTIADIAGDGLLVIDLAELDRSHGFKISGTYNASGDNVSSAGDFNGDGIDDVMIGALFADPLGRSEAGEVYVIYGKAGGTGDIDLDTLTADQGFEILGALPGGHVGDSVSSAGDVNGDGYDDLIIGAVLADPPGRSDAGQSYVIYGTANGPGDIDLATLTAAQGFRVTGAAVGDFSGFAVAGAGDLNGDGIDDLVVGTLGADALGRSDAGKAHIIYGKEGGLGDIDLAALTTDQGFTISGAAAGDLAGRTVDTAGDINGDGIDDLIIGANPAAGPYGQSALAHSYVIYGTNGGHSDIDLATLTAAQGFTITADPAFDYGAYSVSSAGDVNGDGIDDIVIGAPNDHFGFGRANLGHAYLVYGKEGGLGDIELAALTPYDGFKITGSALFDNAGCSVSSAGDVNGDGIDDIIVGAFYADAAGRIYSGESYVIYGLNYTQGALDEIDLAALTANRGFKIAGEESFDFSGRSVSAAGDVNGDGFDDVIVAETFTGESHVIYGGNFTGSVTHPGTTGKDT